MPDISDISSNRTIDLAAARFAAQAPDAPSAAPTDVRETLGDTPSTDAPQASAPPADAPQADAPSSPASQTPTTYESAPQDPPVDPMADILTSIVGANSVAGAIDQQRAGDVQENDPSAAFASDVVDGTTMLFHGHPGLAVRYYEHTAEDLLAVVTHLAQTIGLLPSH